MQCILTIMGNLFGSVLQHVRILYSIQANCVLLRFFLGGGGTPCFRIGVVEDNFFLFLRSLLWELWTPNLLFHSSNVGLKILKKWFMPQVYINGTFKFDQKRNLWNMFRKIITVYHESWEYYVHSLTKKSGFFFS